VGPPEALDTETVDAAIDAIDAIGRDELSVVKAVSPLLAKIPGWTAEELVRNNTLFLVHPDDRGLAIANWMEMLARPGFSQRAVMRYRYRDGQYIWFEVEHSNELNEPTRRLVRSQMVDVSERMDPIILGSANGDRLDDWFANVACADRGPLDSVLRLVLERRLL
jgi:PAS domain S-box-containing protein